MLRNARNLFVIAGLVFPAAALPGVAAGQTDTLFINNANASTLWRVRNGVIEKQLRIIQRYPFIVRGSIELGAGGLTPLQGGRYDYDGTFLGNFDVSPNRVDFDCGTDGLRYIYGTQNISGNTQMWRFDINWKNAEKIFDWQPEGAGIGVTYDPVNDWLWTYSYFGPRGGTVAGCMLNGTRRLVFPVTPNTFHCSIAYETSTDTLWLSQGGPANGVLYQYSKTGTLLRTINLPQPLGDTFSSEFVVPSRPACPADCDQSSQLDVADFICFQNAFALGDMAKADCIRDGRLNIQDFVCFQNEFALGCP